MSTKTNTPEVSSIFKNIMGTITIEMKGKGMRKPQEFIVYPIGKESKNITIQSKTRIGQVELDGSGLMSKSHQNGAYFHHLQMDKLTPFQFNESDWKQIKEYIGLTAGKEVGGSVVKSNNEGAKSIFDL